MEHRMEVFACRASRDFAGKVIDELNSIRNAEEEARKNAEEIVRKEIDEINRKALEEARKKAYEETRIVTISQNDNISSFSDSKKETNDNSSRTVWFPKKCEDLGELKKRMKE